MVVVTLYVGTAGWSYPSGSGRWDGVFYPDKLAVGRPPRAPLPNSLIVEYPELVEGQGAAAAHSGEPVAPSVGKAGA